jgi:geranylgeranyl diphosphate synthase type II
LSAVAELARAAGPAALVGGQMLDLEAEGRPAGAARVRRIHRMKTAALIRCALVLGGLAGGAGARELRRLERVGEEAGLAFQIHDDLLNEGSTLRALGKRSGTDRRRGKATYPSAVGAEAARHEAERRLHAAQREARALGPRASGLLALLEFLSRREH